jgi:hypothetical protein
LALLCRSIAFACLGRHLRTHIQELWHELGRTKSSAPEYETLLEKIRVLSAEYQVIVEAAKKPAKLK